MTTASVDIGTIFNEDITSSDVVLVYNQGDGSPPRRFQFSQRRARRWLNAWFTAAGAAEYELAIWEHLREHDFPPEVVGSFIQRLRAGRTGLLAAADGLQLGPVMTKDGEALVESRFADSAPAYWTPEQARGQGLGVFVAAGVAANETAYLRLLKELTPLDKVAIAEMVDAVTRRCRTDLTLPS
jgi:hypothetical protein